MSLRMWLHQYLGITEIQEDQGMLHDELRSLERVQARVLGQVSSLTPGIGRIIAKLEPGWTVAENDPARKAESDRLADETIRRLEAEAKAREPYNNV
jgi:hypothetical protein